MHILLAVSVLMHPHHRFWVMDDLTPSGSAGADVVLGDLDDPADTELLLIEPEVSFKVAPNFKLELEIPLGIASFATPVDDDETAGFLGNLMLGAMFMQVSHGQDVNTSFGASISYQGLTASDDGEEGFGASQAAAFYFLRDFGRYLPNTDTLRLHGGVGLKTQYLLFQAELGLHIHFFDAPVVGPDDDLTVLRIGLGFGVMISPPLAILAEITTTSFELEDEDNDELYHTIDIGARYENGDTSYSVRLLAPIDDDNTTDAVGIGFDFLARFY